MGSMDFRTEQRQQQTLPSILPEGCCEEQRAGFYDQERAAQRGSGKPGKEQRAWIERWAEVIDNHRSGAPPALKERLILAGQAQEFGFTMGQPVVFPMRFQPEFQPGQEEQR